MVCISEKCGKKPRKKNAFFLFFVVISVFMCIFSFKSPEKRERDEVSIAMVGQDTFELQVKVPDNGSVVVVCGWEYEGNAYVYMLIAFQNSISQFVSKNYTIYVDVYVYQHGEFLYNYSFTYTPDIFTWFVAKLFSNITIILGAIVVILVLYIIIKQVSRG